MQFWSVKLGGDADDTKMFINLKKNYSLDPKKRYLPSDSQKHVNKAGETRVGKRIVKNKSDVMSQFDAYSGI